MSEVKEHLLGDEHELEFEDSPTGNENTGNHDTLYDRTTNFLRSPSLARYFTIAAYVWAALCTIPALIFFIRLANHVCAFHARLQIETDYIVESHILISRQPPHLHYPFHKFTTSTMASVHFARQTLAISPHLTFTNLLNLSVIHAVAFSRRCRGVDVLALMRHILLAAVICDGFVRMRCAKSSLAFQKYKSSATA